LTSDIQFPFDESGSGSGNFNQQSGLNNHGISQFTGEVLKNAAAGGQNISAENELWYWFGSMCQNYFWWWWIIIAILSGLLISKSIRLRGLRKHIPEKLMEDLYMNQAEIQRQYGKKYSRKKSTNK
jgi:hypothetical protein